MLCQHRAHVGGSCQEAAKPAESSPQRAALTWRVVHVLRVAWCTWLMTKSATDAEDDANRGNAGNGDAKMLGIEDALGAAK